MKKKKANIYDAVRAALPAAKGESPKLNERLARVFALSVELQRRLIASNDRIAAAAEEIRSSLGKIADAVDDERFLRIIFSSTSASRPKKPE